jgi:hypothetical protein
MRPIVGLMADRPRVTAFFDDAEQDARLDPLFRAIGRVVLAAGGLETQLLLELAHIRHDRDGEFPGGPELTKLENMPAGYLLKELQKLGLPDDLSCRISGAIERRNELVHHLMEDADIVRAVAGLDEIDAAVDRVDQLALDCAALAGELHVVAGKGVEAAIRKSPSELLAMLQAIDPETMDPRSLRQLEAVRSLDGLDLTLPWQSAEDA